MRWFRNSGQCKQIDWLFSVCVCVLCAIWRFCLLCNEIYCILNNGQNISIISCARECQIIIPLLFVITFPFAMTLMRMQMLIQFKVYINIYTSFRLLKSPKYWIFDEKCCSCYAQAATKNITHCNHFVFAYLASVSTSQRQEHSRTSNSVFLFVQIGLSFSPFLCYQPKRLKTNIRQKAIWSRPRDRCACYKNRIILRYQLRNKCAIKQ